MDKLFRTGHVADFFLLFLLNIYTKINRGEGKNNDIMRKLPNLSFRNNQCILSSIALEIY